MENIVAELRNKSGISQEKFANMLGITRSHLSNIENNKVPNLSGLLMLRIAKEFGEPVEKIFFALTVRNSEQKKGA